MIKHQSGVIRGMCRVFSSSSRLVLTVSDHLRISSDSLIPSRIAVFITRYISQQQIINVINPLASMKSVSRVNAIASGSISFLLL